MLLYISSVRRIRRGTLNLHCSEKGAKHDVWGVEAKKTSQGYLRLEKEAALKERTVNCESFGIRQCFLNVVVKWVCECVRELVLRWFINSLKSGRSTRVEFIISNPATLYGGLLAPIPPLFTIFPTKVTAHRLPI